MGDNRVIVLILALAATLRLVGVNWDAGMHLHPDERFLTMVATAMKLPITPLAYLDQSTSTFNPYNVGFNFVVYGSFPIMLVKLAAILYRQDTYELIVLVGRTISAFFDLGTVCLVFLMGRWLERQTMVPRNTSYWAALVYALAVYPIQASHFFTVDTFATFFTTAAVAASFGVLSTGKYRWVVLSAVSFGLALACKISGAAVLPILLLGLISWDKKQFAPKNILRAGVFGLVSYAALRLGNPYYFASSSFLNPLLSPHYLANISELKSLVSPGTSFPPSNQWIHTAPVAFSLVNLAYYGLGIVPFFFVVFGLGTVLWKKLKTHSKQPLLPLIAVWVVAFFCYQSIQFVKSIRYLYVLYPFLALMAGVGIVSIQNKYKKRVKKHLVFVQTAIVLGLLIWPLAFVSIYAHTNTRVRASSWMYQHIEAGASIAVEHWDDALPLPVPHTRGGGYAFVELPVFYPDDRAKWEAIDEAFSHVDYYVLSSNRAWRSILSTPEKYPRMSRFYNDLLQNKTQFTLVSEFHETPSLRYLGIPLDLPDLDAEETFTVYDHPQVLLYKNTKK